MKDDNKRKRITKNTRIKELLDMDQPRVIEALVKLNDNFSKLKNPVLRNLLARRVTISDACKIARCEVSSFLKSMEQIGFLIDEASPGEASSPAKLIDFSRQAKVHELDVRPFLEKDEDPLKEILSLAATLRKGERLKIINSFEPVPLISLFEEKGFLHHTDAVASDVFLTWFEKNDDHLFTDGLLQDLPVTDEKELFDMVLRRYMPEKIIYIDVCSLEMPQPMMCIVENIEKMAVDELLYVYHKKVPVFLLPELKKRGLKFIIQQHSDSRLDLLIYQT